MLKSICVTLILAGVGSAAIGGTVYQSAIVVSPQMQLREGEVDGCGFQFKSMPLSSASEKTPVMLDVSLNLYAGFYAGMKGGASHIGVTNGAPSTRKSLPVSSFWLKSVGQKATTPNDGRTMPANDPGYLLYLADFNHVAKLFYAVLDGQQISLGVHVKGESVERIYVGVPFMQEEEKTQSKQCMEELLARMKASLETEQSKSPSGK